MVDDKDGILISANPNPDTRGPITIELSHISGSKKSNLNTSTTPTSARKRELIL
jgi:hypothetical protein